VCGGHDDGALKGEMRGGKGEREGRAYYVQINVLQSLRVVVGGADLSRATGTDLRVDKGFAIVRTRRHQPVLGRLRKAIHPRPEMSEAVYFANDGRLHASHRT
jgi:hypothetical protein